MKLHHLRDILAVAECGSLRAAGRHLNIAQPAITRSIQEVERELGISLFERHSGGVRLTALGKVFLRRAKSIENELRRATEELDQMRGLPTGHVAAAMSSAVIIALLPRSLSAFRKRYPDTLFKCSEALFQSAESGINSGQIDFYVGPVEEQISSQYLTMEPIAEFRRVVVARRGHPLSQARSVGDLSGAQWIRPTLSARDTEVDVDRMLSELGAGDASVVMHAHSTLASLVTQLNSDLLTIVPEVCLEQPPFVEHICALNLEEKLPPVKISIVCRNDLPLTPMAEYMADMVRRAGLKFCAEQ